MESKSTLVHVGVRTSNLQKSIGFWRDGLGLSVYSSGVDSYDLTDGYHNFRVFQHKGAARASHVSGMVDYLHIGVCVPDLSKAAQRLSDMGFIIFLDGVSGDKVYDPSSPPERSFKVEDPDGITVDVTASEDQWPGVRPRDADGRWRPHS